LAGRKPALLLDAPTRSRYDCITGRELHCNQYAHKDTHFNQNKNAHEYCY